MFKAYKLASRMPFVDWAVATVGIFSYTPNGGHHRISHIRAEVIIKITTEESIRSEVITTGYAVDLSAAVSLNIDTEVGSQFGLNDAQRWFCSTVERMMNDIREQNDNTLFPLIEFVDDTSTMTLFDELALSGKIEPVLSRMKMSSLREVSSAAPRYYSVVKPCEFNDKR